MGFLESVIGVTQGAELVAVLAGAFTALVGSVFSLLAKGSSDRGNRSATTNFQATNDLITDSRLSDLKKELDRNRVIARLNSSAATLLTFSQFIVGGLLASSFIQESLSPSTVGLLGLLVLLASLINQRYRPDLHAAQAKQRMFKAKKLIRVVEDDLFALSNGMSRAPNIFEVREKASIGLSELEDIEIDGSMAIAAQTATADTSNGGGAAIGRPPAT